MPNISASNNETCETESPNSFSSRLPTKRACTLDEALDYRSDLIIHTFTTKFDIPEEEADELFTETKKYLWVCSKSSSSIAPVRIIDQMWHIFILFTPEYFKYCHQKFGFYVHHVPADKRNFPPEEKRRRLQESRKQFTRHLEIVNQLLGKETVVKWYIEYAQRYDTEFYNKHAIIPEGVSVDFSHIYAK